ncbi:MAG: hypothetical protein HN380_10870 [Victivallales bacterium]|nr:hypothetical protein [Victivallales bacterium]
MKENRPGAPFDHLKGMWRVKGQMEYSAGVELHAAGIPVAVPVAWARLGTRSWSVSRELSEVSNFLELVCAEGPRLVDDGGFLSALAEFSRLLIDRGVFHPDMHGGNVVVRREAGGWRFFLIDVYGAGVCGNVPHSARVRSLIWLMPVIRRLPLAARDDFLARALGGGDHAPQAMWPALLSVALREARRRWPGRKSRLLRTSSLCEAHSDSHGHWLTFTTFPLQRAVQAVESCLNNAPSTTLLKKDVKRRVMRVKDGAGTLIVKFYHRCSYRGPFRADRRSFLAMHHLAVLGADETPTAYAWLRRPNGEGVLVMEDVGYADLRHVLATEPDESQRRGKLRQLAELVARWHERGIHHADLKLTNVVVGHEGLRIVDCDDVRFPSCLPEKARAKNLRQILENFPAGVPLRARLGFLVCYRRATGLPREWLRAFWGEVAGGVRAAASA